MTVLNVGIAETTNITQNGTYDVARYTTANVNVESIPVLAMQYRKDASGKVLPPTTFMDLGGATDIGNDGLYYACYNNTSLSGELDLSSLTNISGSRACQYAFAGCTGITSVNLSGLIRAYGSESTKYMFQNCTNIVSVNISNLEAIYEKGMQHMFNGCTGLTTVVFNKLERLGNYGLGGCFSGCTGLTSISFPALKGTQTANGLSGMLNSSVVGCTIHFPSNLDPQGGSTVISSLTGYPNFGGTNTVLAFDLPATE